MANVRRNHWKILQKQNYRKLPKERILKPFLPLVTSQRQSRRQYKERNMENRIWKIRFADGTVGSCWGTKEGAAEITDLKKDLYGSSYTIEGR